MKFSIVLTQIIAVAAAPRPQTSTGGGDISNLVPQFGVVPGTGRDAVQKGSCSGSDGQKQVLIPCSCPPDRGQFISKLQDAVSSGSFLGEPITFNTDASDQSPETNKARATAALIVLQSFNGQKGSGCPAASAPNLRTQQLSGIRNNNTMFVG